MASKLGLVGPSPTETLDEDLEALDFETESEEDLDDLEGLDETEDEGPPPEFATFAQEALDTTDELRIAALYDALKAIR